MSNAGHSNAVGGWNPAIMTNKPREQPCVVWFGDGAGGAGKMD